MSTATRVPETFDLDGDDARQTLATVGKKKLLKDAFVRLRAADGTSHARSLAFMVSLCLVQGLIVLLGVAASLANVGLTTTVADNISAAVPGPAGSVLTDAVEQARKLNDRHQFIPLLVAIGGLIVTTTFAMGQIERGLNRIYGVERDRPAAEKYKRALYLALSVGPLFAIALLFIGFAADPDARVDRHPRLDLDLRPLGVGLRTRHRRPHVAAPLLPEPPPAGPSLARLRRAHRRPALGHIHRPPRARLPARINLPADLWAASRHRRATALGLPLSARDLLRRRRRRPTRRRTSSEPRAGHGWRRPTSRRSTPGSDPTQLIAVVDCSRDRKQLQAVASDTP